MHTNTLKTFYLSQVNVLNQVLNSLFLKDAAGGTESVLIRLLSNSLILPKHLLEHPNCSAEPQPDWVPRSITIDENSNIFKALELSKRKKCFDVYAALLRLHRAELNCIHFIMRYLPKEVSRKVDGITDKYVDKYIGKNLPVSLDDELQYFKEHEKGFGYCFWDFPALVTAHKSDLEFSVQVILTKLHIFMELEKMISLYVPKAPSLQETRSEYIDASKRLRTEHLAQQGREAIYPFH